MVPTTIRMGDIRTIRTAYVTFNGSPETALFASTVFTEDANEIIPSMAGNTPVLLVIFVGSPHFSADGEGIIHLPRHQVGIV